MSSTASRGLGTCNCKGSFKFAASRLVLFNPNRDNPEDNPSVLCVNSLFLLCLSIAFREGGIEVGRAMSGAGALAKSY